MLFIIFYLIFCYYFFRIPNHKIKYKNNDNNIIAPAYGKILSISERGSFIQIATFINLNDVHIQYAPTKCYLEHMIYKKGTFTPAFMIKSENNERLEYHCRNSKGIIIFAQIAGVLANTIIPFVKKGDFLKKGQEFGLIKFGSRCDILIEKHKNLKILVKEGQKVEGGQTIIASYY